LAQGEPPALGSDLESVELAARACEPPLRDRKLAANRLVVPRDRSRDARGRAPVAALAVETVGVLARLEGQARVIEPPARRAETFERLGRLLLDEGGLERAPGFLPRAPGKRLAA